MNCKKCHIVDQHELIPSGDSHPKSLKCPVCNAIHDDNGELFDPDRPRGIDVIKQQPTECPNCGSQNVIRQVFQGTFFCRDCRRTF